MTKTLELRETNIRTQLYQTALAAGLPIISTDTAAKILSVTYIHGNNEFMTHNDKFLTEINYIKNKWNIDDGCIPDAIIMEPIRYYIAELEQYEKSHPKERYTPWAIQLFKERYGVKLIN